jgi:hypothetical protein
MTLYFFDKIDYNLLSNLFTGGNNCQEVLSIINEEIDRASVFYPNNLTYEKLFQRFSNLEFRKIEKNTAEYLKRLEKELEKVEILNVT